MKKKQLQTVVAQLAHPSGEQGSNISTKMNDTNAFITARTIEALAPVTGEFIVELGPGNGALSGDLVQTIGPEGRYLGIELSSDMAQAARKCLGDIRGAQVDIHAGDCHDAVVVDASVDGLMAVNVLYFIDDLDALFARIKPWFKPNGRCVFGIRPVNTLKALRFDEFGYHIRSPEEIGNAMQEHGFGGISITQYNEAEGSLGDLRFPSGSIIIRASVHA